MERLSERLIIAKRALSTLKEILQAPVSSIVRDAAIQRFEYTFEAAWKTAQRYLLDIEGVDAGSPKSVIRGCFTGGILDENASSLALEMADVRNLTVHTYNEALADRIYSHLPAYADLMEKWLSAISLKLPR